MGDDFYQSDRCLGSVCTVNGKNVYGLFNADLKEIKPIVGSIAANYSKSIGASSLHVNNYELGTSGIQMVFYVGGAHKEDCYINTSNLIAECRNCVIKTDADGFEYVSILTGYNINETGIEFYNEVTLTFATVRRLPLVTKVLENGNGVVKNIGSIKSGARLVITPSSNIEAFTINGITIKNMSSGLPFVIDGIVGEVKCNGINRFLDTDLIEFPKVYPGDNEIVVSDTNVKVEVSFYPTFIV